MAAGLGLEPRLMGPKPIVLPLDDPAKYYGIINYLVFFFKSLQRFSFSHLFQDLCNRNLYW